MSDVVVEGVQERGCGHREIPGLKLSPVGSECVWIHEPEATGRRVVEEEVGDVGRGQIIYDGD